MIVVKYLDTVVEDSERIRKGREHINRGINFIFCLFLFFLVGALILYFLEFYVYSFYFWCITIVYTILLVALIHKRETYSVMIYLKEKEVK